MKSSK